MELHVFEDSTHVVIAESARAALDIVCDNYGVPRDANDDTLEENGIDPLREWAQKPDDALLDVGSDDEEAFKRRKMTCVEWCRAEPRGLLGSSEW